VFLVTSTCSDAYLRGTETSFQQLVYVLWLQNRVRIASRWNNRVDPGSLHPWSSDRCCPTSSKTMRACSDGRRGLKNVLTAAERRKNFHGLRSHYIVHKGTSLILPSNRFILRPSLLRSVTQCKVVRYRRFGTSYQSHLQLQGSRSLLLDPCRWNRYVVLKRRYVGTLRCFTDVSTQPIGPIFSFKY
jgi:hypothetical protein